MLKTLSILIVLAAACGGSPKKGPDSTAPTGGGATEAGVQLTLGELKLVDINKNKAVVVRADGTIELNGKAMAKVSTDGKISKLEGGDVGFTLQTDGTIMGPKGKDLGVKLNTDGTATMGDKTISVDDKGELVGGNASAPKMRIEGATDANLKRTALFVLIALTAPADVTSEVKTGSAPAPK